MSMFSLLFFTNSASPSTFSEDYICFVDKLICLYLLQGKADGNKCALWVRWHLQKYMFSIGCFIQLHCGKVLFMGLLMLSLCCIGFKLVKFETDVEDLWVEGKLSCKFYAFIFHLITCNEKIHSQTSLELLKLVSRHLVL